MSVDRQAAAAAGPGPAARRPEGQVAASADCTTTTRTAEDGGLHADGILSVLSVCCAVCCLSCVRSDRRLRKEKFVEKLKAAVAAYKNVLIVGVDNVGSNQVRTYSTARHTLPLDLTVARSATASASRCMRSSHSHTCLV
jgi:hypothetical protein